MIDKAPSKSDQLRALREARTAERNTPEASGTTRKVPSDALFGASSLSKARASTHPERKQPKAKPTKPNDVSASGRVVSRLGAGRTAHAPIQPTKADGGAIRLKPGRPKITIQRPWEAMGMSRRTYYRRLKGEKK